MRWNRLKNLVAPAAALATSLFASRVEAAEKPKVDKIVQVTRDDADAVFYQNSRPYTGPLSANEEVVELNDDDFEIIEDDEVIELSEADLEEIDTEKVTELSIDDIIALHKPSTPPPAPKGKVKGKNKGKNASLGKITPPPVPSVSAPKIADATPASPMSETDAEWDDILGGMDSKNEVGPTPTSTPPSAPTVTNNSGQWSTAFGEMDEAWGEILEAAEEPKTHATIPNYLAAKMSASTASIDDLERDLLRAYQEASAKLAWYYRNLCIGIGVFSLACLGGAGIGIGRRRRRKNDLEPRGGKEKAEEKSGFQFADTIVDFGSSDTLIIEPNGSMRAEEDIEEFDSSLLEEIDEAEAVPIDTGFKPIQPTVTTGKKLDSTYQQEWRLAYEESGIPGILVKLPDLFDQMNEIFDVLREIELRLEIIPPSAGRKRIKIKSLKPGVSDKVFIKDEEGFQEHVNLPIQSELDRFLSPNAIMDGKGRFTTQLGFSVEIQEWIRKREGSLRRIQDGLQRKIAEHVDKINKMRQFEYAKQAVLDLDSAYKQLVEIVQTLTDVKTEFTRIFRQYERAHRMKGNVEAMMSKTGGSSVDNDQCLMERNRHLLVVATPDITDLAEAYERANLKATLGDSPYFLNRISPDEIKAQARQLTDKMELARTEAQESVSKLRGPLDTIKNRVTTLSKEVRRESQELTALDQAKVEARMNRIKDLLILSQDERTEMLEELEEFERLAEIANSEKGRKSNFRERLASLDVELERIKGLNARSQWPDEGRLEDTETLRNAYAALHGEIYASLDGLKFDNDLNTDVATKGGRVNTGNYEATDQAATA